MAASVPIPAIQYRLRIAMAQPIESKIHDSAFVMLAQEASSVSKQCCPRGHVTHGTSSGDIVTCILGGCFLLPNTPYHLSAQFFVNRWVYQWTFAFPRAMITIRWFCREALVQDNRKAKVIIRPSLTLKQRRPSAAW